MYCTVPVCGVATIPEPTLETYHNFAHLRLLVQLIQSRFGTLLYIVLEVSIPSPTSIRLKKKVNQEH